MTLPRLSVTEKIILIIVAASVAAGYWLFYTNLPRFEQYVREDGIAEWLTVAGLLLGSIVCFYRFIKLFRKKSAWFLLVTFCLGLFLFFAAGEEISWGQRIFGLKTPEYFQEHNAQHETNLHNLVVGGVKINKLIFSVLLVGLLAIFMIIVPVLYQKNSAVKKFLDGSGCACSAAIPGACLYPRFCFNLINKTRKKCRNTGMWRSAAFFPHCPVFKKQGNFFTGWQLNLILMNFREHQGVQFFFTGSCI